MGPHADAHTPVARIDAYFDAITAWLEASGWRFGCLVGNLSLEVAEDSDLLRGALAEVCASLTEAFTEAVRLAQEAGEVRRDLDAGDVAAVLLSSWQGAMMRMKVDRSPVPLEQFRRVMAATVLAPAPDAGR